MAPSLHPPTVATRVLLARHGEVDARHRGTIYGRLDVELSEAGLRQSQAMANSLEGVQLDAVISSGLRRAEAAASLVRSPRGLPRHDDPRLVEMDRGAWAGVALSGPTPGRPRELSSVGAAERSAPRPGGESPADVAARVIPAIGDLAAGHPGGRILIVAHMWVVRSAVCHALEIPMERSPAIALQPGGLVALDWPPQPATERPRLAALGLGGTAG